MVVVCCQSDNSCVHAHNPDSTCPYLPVHTLYVSPQPPRRQILGPRCCGGPFTPSQTSVFPHTTPVSLCCTSRASCTCTLNDAPPRHVSRRCNTEPHASVIMQYTQGANNDTHLCLQLRQPCASNGTRWSCSLLFQSCTPSAAAQTCEYKYYAL